MPMPEEVKNSARRQLEEQLAKMNVPEGLKDERRQQLETLLLQKDLESGAANNDYFGAEKWDDAVQRYRDLGARTRAPIALDQRQADQARGLQIGALGTLDAAARGQAPSQAAITGQLQREQIQQGAAQSLGGARGPAGQIVAAKNAGGVMGNQLVGSLANTTLARAGEANTDRNALVGAAGGVRAQDIGAATTNAELLAKSRAQDEARQQGYERMGWNTRNAQQQSNMEIHRQQQDKQNELLERKRQDNARSSGAGKTAASAAMGVGMSLLSFLSDERTKHALPVGALAHLGRK